jgi:hypothetical protein
MKWPHFATTIALGDLAEAGAVIVAAVAITMELRRAKRGAEMERRVHEDELRWRRADAARTLLTDIHNPSGDTSKPASRRHLKTGQLQAGMVSVSF